MQTYRLDIKRMLLISVIILVLAVLGANLYVKAEEYLRIDHIQSEGTVEFPDGDILIDGEDLNYLTNEIDNVDTDIIGKIASLEQLVN